MSALSAQLLTTGLSTGTPPALPRVDLLPPEIVQSRRFRRLQQAMGGSLVATLAVVLLLYVAAVGGVRDARAELASETASGAALQAETARYVDVRAVYARAEAAKTMLTQAMSDEVRYAEYLRALSLAVPDGVWLKSVGFSQTPVPEGIGTTAPGIATVTFTGVAFTHDHVADWLDSLAGQAGYVDARLGSSTATRLDGRDAVDFTATVTMTAEALSGRFAPRPGG